MMSSSTQAESTVSALPVQPSNNTTPKRGSDDGSDWQASKSLLSESFHHIFENKILCDVNFSVGTGPDKETISAHKLVLSARSAVFFTMFTKKWSADDHNEINVLDIEPPAFKDMLRFMYSDNLELTLETVTAVTYAAKKYSIVALENKCSDFLFKNLCPENVCNILIQARLFDMEKLANDCLDIIAKDTDTALNTEDFLNIDVETLCLILERPDLRIDEISLFHLVNSWAETACVINNRSINPKHKLLFLKDALSLLRFPLMSPEDFSKKVVTTGLLTDEEIISVLLHFSTKSRAEDCIFSTIPRRAFLVFNRFRYEVNGGDFGGTNPNFYHKIQFHSSHKISLVGIGLYGNPGVTYPVDIMLQYNYNNTLKTYSGNYYCSDKIFRIFFPEPFEIMPDQSYAHLIQAKIQGQYSTYGCSGHASMARTMMINNEKTTVTITFSPYENVSSEGNRGHMSDVNSGQIPELLFDL